MNSRLLPSWLPLHRCTIDGCDQSGAFDRQDGRCYFHSKVADGLFASRVRNVLHTCGKYPWDLWFDGNEHLIHPAVGLEDFRRVARDAAARRGLTVSVERAGDAVALRSFLRLAA
jgi:hypothetical protein